MKVSLFRSILSLAVLCVVLTMSAVAQDLDDVGISGRVTDTNGEAIPGATVTAKLIQTGQSRSVTTNASGRYQLIELPPGTYTIRFEAQGFGAKERIDLVTLSGQNLQLDMSLSPADVQAEATVTVDDDDAPAVDTSRVVVGGTVSRIEIEELPNFDRNPLDLVLTLGGTAEESLSTSGLAEDRLQSPSSAPLSREIFHCPAALPIRTTLPLMALITTMTVHLGIAFSLPWNLSRKFRLLPTSSQLSMDVHPAAVSTSEREPVIIVFADVLLCSFVMRG